MGKPGRAPTSGTRKGNGAGWGGPAKGAAVNRPETIATQPEWPAGQVQNPGGVLSERKARMQMKAYDVLESAMSDPDMRVAVTAADKALDRIEGRPMQKIVTPDSAPHWFMQGAAEIEDPQTWEDRAQLAVMRPLGNAD